MKPTQSFQRLSASICKASINMCWLMIIVLLLWKIISQFREVSVGEIVAFNLMILLPITYIALFTIHLISFIISLITDGINFNSRQIVYYISSDIFFVLLIIFVIFCFGYMLSYTPAN